MPRCATARVARRLINSRFLSRGRLKSSPSSVCCVPRRESCPLPSFCSLCECDCAPRVYEGDAADDSLVYGEPAPHAFPSVVMSSGLEHTEPVPRVFLPGDSSFHMERFGRRMRRIPVQLTTRLFGRQLPIRRACCRERFSGGFSPVLVPIFCASAYVYPSAQRRTTSFRHCVRSTGSALQPFYHSVCV